MIQVSSIQYGKPGLFQKTRFLSLLSSIQHPASNIQHPASNIQHPASNIQHQTSSIQHQTSSIQHQTQTSNPKEI
ncbi:hypothetical protein QUF72_19790 [Desulfobacterales bacterium HSG2]|nr:hypothetical protein [Desulfobacterales bacterium HSG2]